MFSNNTTTITIMWIVLIAIKHHVCSSKVIIVNNNGSNSAACCMNGTCLCSSLHDTLQSIENNTVVNITSEFVLLEDRTYIRVKHLNNVNITGNNVVVMCNNKGGMSWRSGNNILIEGITWDQCGDPKHTRTPAIQFEDVHHISISKCTFQHSKVCQTVYLVPGEEKHVFIFVSNTNFILNKVENAADCQDTYGSIIIQDYSYLPTKNATIFISGSSFYSNGNPGQHSINDELVFAALYCFLYSPLAVKFVVENSIIYSNKISGMYLYNNAVNISQIVLNNVTVFNNSGGVKIFKQRKYMILDVVSCNFSQNSNGAFVLDMNGNTNFVNLTEVIFVKK